MPGRPHRSSQPAYDEDEHQVQILDLHSTAPLVSYKGHVYQGQWSENVGTELLITKRGHASASALDPPPPAIRHLDHDVALLAASCARITVQEKALKPKPAAPRAAAAAAPRRARNPHFARDAHAMRPLVPPAERWSTQARRDQGHFLARLIQIKRARGEKDHVTVVAKGVDPRNSRKPKKRKQGHRGKFNLPHHRGPRRARAAADLLRTLSIRDQNAQREAMAMAGGQGAGGKGGPISTPTPARWDDLKYLEYQDDGDGDGGGDGDGDGDGDGNGDGDGDGDGEGDEGDDTMADYDDEGDGEEEDENEDSGSQGSSADEMDVDEY